MESFDGRFLIFKINPSTLERESTYDFFQLLRWYFCLILKVNPREADMHDFFQLHCSLIVQTICTFNIEIIILRSNQDR